DQPFASSTGKLSRGEEYVLLARTHHALPSNVKITGRIGGKDTSWTYPISIENDVVTSLVPRLWASEYIRRLIGSGSDENRSKILSLGLEYGLITPHTSILALESDAAYAAQGIPRRNSPLRGVRLTSIENSTQEKALIDRFGVVPPAVMAGCDNKAEPAGAQASSNLAPESVATKTASGMQNGAAAENQARGDLPTTPSPTAAMPVGAASAASVFGMQQGQDEEPSANDGFKGQGALAIGAGGGVAVDHGAAAKPTMHAPRRPAAISAKDGEPRGGGRVVVDALLDKNAEKKEGDRQQPADSSITLNRKIRMVLSRCSDAASRPLAERIVLWTQRLKPLTQATDVLSQFNSARSACELPDWRDEAALLDLVEKKVMTEDGATLVLSSFSGDPDAQAFVARKILQRTVDVRIAAAVERTLFGGVDWQKIDRDLADIKKPDDRLAHLRAAMLQAPGDPQGDVRLVKMLVDTGARDEAIAHGRRLRDRGLLTPTLAQELGDVLADAGETDEALRTYSEVVEFDPNDPAARRVLGDIYLRRGWFDAAYRQYKTLIDIDGKDPLSHLRLASAAAGAGRVDEALRIERDVAGGEGNPGPDDPRVFARLESATRLGALYAAPAPNSPIATTEAIARKLKELGLFSGPGTLAILTWEDRDAQLLIGAADDKNNALAGETTDAGAVGLYSVLSANDAFAKVQHAVRWKADAPGRSVKFRVSLISWDGKTFHVTVKDGSLDATAKSSPI
ncbi:MAG: tetratricopeptide repeat protein, partial [Polyangiaceae bacterium]